MEPLNLYCVASLLREDSPLGLMLERMREKLRKNRIPFEEPKLYDHISWLPPFFATEDFAQGLSKGLRFCRVFEKGATVSMETKSCRYLDTDQRACCVLLELPREVKECIEDLRISIPSNRWKFPPDRYTLLTHATAAVTPKGESSFYESIQALPKEERPDSVVTQLTNPVPTIFLNKKNEGTGKWSPVHF